MMHGWLPDLPGAPPGRREDATFGRYSAQGREVIISAQQEARALHHNYLGTEHLLLGLLRDRDGVGGRTLHVLGISVETARAQVLEIIGEGKQEPRGASSRSRPGLGRSWNSRSGRALQAGHLPTWARNTSSSAWCAGERGRLAGAQPPRRHGPERSGTRSWSWSCQPAQRPAEVITPPGIAATTPGSSWPGRPKTRRWTPGTSTGPRPPGRARRNWWPSGTGFARWRLSRGRRGHAGPRARLAARRGEPAAAAAAGARHRARAPAPAPRGPRQQTRGPHRAIGLDRRGAGWPEGQEQADEQDEDGEEHHRGNSVPQHGPQPGQVGGPWRCRGRAGSRTRARSCGPAQPVQDHDEAPGQGQQRQQCPAQAVVPGQHVRPGHQPGGGERERAATASVTSPVPPSAVASLVSPPGVRPGLTPGTG